MKIVIDQPDFDPVAYWDDHREPPVATVTVDVTGPGGTRLTFDGQVTSLLDMDPRDPEMDQEVDFSAAALVRMTRPDGSFTVKIQHVREVHFGITPEPEQAADDHPVT